MKNKYKTTKLAYNNNAIHYFKKTKTAFIPPPLRGFADSLIPGSTVIDLGCGPGYISKLFTDRKLNYVGIDFSPTTIKLASQNNPSVKFIVGDFLNLNYKKDSIDAFLAIASLYHLNKKDFRKVIKSLHMFLKPNGQLYFVMKKGDREHLRRDKRYSSGKKFVAYYSKKELESIVKHTGFKIKRSFIVKKKNVRSDLKSNYENRSVIVLWVYK